MGWFLADLPVHKQNRNLDFDPEFSNQFRLFFQPKNLKSENNSP
jgi:hypothetical protein